MVLRDRRSYDPEGEVSEVLTIEFHIEMDEVKKTTLVLAAIQLALSWL